MSRSGWSVIVSFLALLSGCAEEKEPAGEGHEFTLKGAVLLPTPMSGAQLDVFRVDSQGHETRVGGGLSGDQGAFSIDLAGIRTGDLLLVRASGAEATWHDVGWDSERHLGDGYSLEAAFLFAPEGQDEVLVLDPFSSLVVGLAKAYSRDPASAGLTSGTWESVLPVAADRLGQHLLSGAPPEVGRTVPELPSKDHSGPVSGKTALALAQVGLSRLVHGWCPQSDTGLQELTAALVADATDGVLDGSGLLPDKNTPGPLFVCGEPLSVDTLRHDLAEAVHSWVAFEEAVVLAAELGRRSGMYDSLALDDGPLFSGLPGSLFDPLKPEFHLSPDSPADDTLLCSKAVLKVNVIDDHALAGVVRVAPDPGSFPDEVVLDAVAGTATITVEVNPDEALEPAYPKAHFIYRATDSSGNSTEFDIHYRFDRDAPVIKSVAPAPSECLPEVPEAFLVEVTDEPEESVDAVVLRIGGTEQVCSALEAGKWSCAVGGLPDGSQVALEVIDSCGNQASIQADACLDGEPPTVEFMPPEGGWYSPASPNGQVQVSDGKGISSVLVSGPLGELTCDAECTLDVPLPTDGTKPVTVEVVAVDVAGRETVASVHWQMDGTGPLLSVSGSQTVLKPAEVVSLLVTASDADSGVAGVAVQGGGADWTLAQTSGDTYLATGKFEAIPDEGFVTLVLLAQDAVGNEASLNFGIWFDSTPPTITLLETVFQDESGAKATYNPQSGDVKYDLAGTPSVTFNPLTCATVCPEFSRLASRLPLSEGDDLEEENVPRWSLLVDDPCPPDGIDFQTTLVTRYYRDEALLKEVSYEPMFCGAWPTFAFIGLQLFSDTPPAEFTFEEGLVPNRLVIEAIDLAGNTSQQELKFVMHVLPPPLFLVDVPPQEWPPDTLSGACAPFTTNLHTLEESPGLLTVKKLVNPTQVAALASIEQIPTEKVEMLSSRVYLPQEGVCTGACPTGQCKVQAPPPSNPACGEAPEFLPESWWGGTIFASLHASPAFEGTPNPLPEGFEMALPAGEEIVLEVRTRYGDEGLDLPEPAEVTSPAGKKEPAYVLSDADWLASCTWNAGLPPKPTCYTMPELLVGFSSSPAMAAIGLAVRTPAGPGQSLQLLPAPWNPVVWVPAFSLEYGPF